MGQQNQFKSGYKAPNNGVYIEIGETGDSVQNPKQVHLEAGSKFPETTNEDRVWTYKDRH